jgi:hypothetical protein
MTLLYQQSNPRFWQLVTKKVVYCYFRSSIWRLVGLGSRNCFCLALTHHQMLFSRSYQFLNSRIQSHLLLVLGIWGSVTTVSNMVEVDGSVMFA